MTAGSCRTPYKTRPHTNRLKLRAIRGVSLVVSSSLEDPSDRKANHDLLDAVR